MISNIIKQIKPAVYNVLNDSLNDKKDEQIKIKLNQILIKPEK